MVGILVVGCVIVTSASLLYIHRFQQQEVDEFQNTEQDYIIFDDSDLPGWEEDTWLDEDSELVRHDVIMAFTRTHGKNEKQLPLIGLPDKALYNIH